MLWAFSPDDDLSARALLLMDAKTGKVLYQKNADIPLPPASTTKVLTAILTLESQKRSNDRLSVSKAATRVPASKLYLKPGQTVSIEDLLYGVLLASANDASVVLAEGIGGSVERFAEIMTKKAHDLGATNSRFSNPHGLTAADHYSTARDLALIFKYAMKNPTFRQIVHTKMSSVRSVSPGKKTAQTRRISVRNHNRLLWNYDGAIGGKTGYTFAAQKCYVGAVERDGVTLIVSLLGSRDLWGDTKRLLEYGFDNYQALNTLPPAAARSITTQRGNPNAAKLSALVAMPQEATAPKPFTDGYVLQVGSFREQHRAEALVKAFSEKGFDVFVEKTSSSDKGETSYRVRLGPFAELSEAQHFLKEVLEESGHRAIVLPYSVIHENEAVGSHIDPPL
ncbi:MAG TPA: D-alanyl-D-alanine carboxypeptidase [Candidatus Polarisedimenticolaceae bacterium]|nr:D-alanyl-D-alanine carboxypeptidase [Candidatus Polarisedimenticolaceae bacterium]